MGSAAGLRHKPDIAGEQERNLRRGDVWITQNARVHRRWWRRIVGDDRGRGGPRGSAEPEREAGRHRRQKPFGFHHRRNPATIVAGTYRARNRQTSGIWGAPLSRQFSVWTSVPGARFGSGTKGSPD